MRYDTSGDDAGGWRSPCTQKDPRYKHLHGKKLNTPSSLLATSQS